MRKKFLFIQFLCIMMMYFLSSQSSAIMIALSTEELTNKSKIIIRGEVLETEALWSKDGKTIITRASVKITDTIIGEASSNMITVEYQGGEIGDVGLRVSDVAPLEVGEEVILFLRSIKSKIEGDAHNLVGNAQGKYTIDNEGIARKGGFSVLSGEDIIDYDIPVEKLIDKIRRAK